MSSRNIDLPTGSLPSDSPQPVPTPGARSTLVDPGLDDQSPWRLTPGNGSDAWPLSGQSIRVECPECHLVGQTAIDDDVRHIRCRACGREYGLTEEDSKTPLATLGRFNLIRQLGVGGFGVVWKAWDSQLRFHVALKFPRRNSLSDEESQRMLREARTVARLDHPHIVGLHNLVELDGRLVLICQYVDGVSLDAVLRQRKFLPPHEVAQLGVPLADALHYAHSRGFVHRDIKPSNVLIDEAGSPAITDFGLARVLVDDTMLTRDGQLIGTPAFMSPEQAEGRGSVADARSDVYSMGTLLYVLLTGEQPFRGTMRMLLDQIINDAPPPPRRLNAAVDRPLETVILKCLAKSPVDRYATAADLRDDLQRYVNDEPIRARPPTPLQLFRHWYPRHASLMLGAFYMVAPLLWIFFIAGGWLQTAADDRLRLASPGFLMWAGLWVGLGYMMLKYGFLFELANIPAILAFALLPLFIHDDPQGCVLVGLITLIGVLLQVGAITSHLTRKRRPDDESDGQAFEPPTGPVRHKS